MSETIQSVSIEMTLANQLAVRGQQVIALQQKVNQLEARVKELEMAESERKSEESFGPPRLAEEQELPDSGLIRRPKAG